MADRLVAVGCRVEERREEDPGALAYYRRGADLGRCLPWRRTTGRPRLPRPDRPPAVTAMLLSPVTARVTVLLL